MPKFTRIRSISILFLLVTFYLWRFKWSDLSCNSTNNERLIPSQIEGLREREMIFIGGSPSSGATLVRLLLDVQPQVKCGEETKIVPRFLQMLQKEVLRSEYVVDKMKLHGISNETLREAAAFFLYHLIHTNKKNSQSDTRLVKFLCDKEPYNAEFMILLNEIFPNAKFIYVVRDGRDASYSLHRRKKLANQGGLWAGLDYNLEQWNMLNKIALESCESLGPAKCHMVRYEKLVNEPEPVLRGLMEFLDLPWTDDLLQHEKLLQDGRIRLIKSPLNVYNIWGKISNSSVGKWRGNIPNYDEESFLKRYPMLRELGYA